MSALPGRGGDGAGAGRAQPATGSSTTDRKICSTVSGALSRARSALRLGKISGIWQRQPFALPSRARARRRRIPVSSEADRPAPAGGAALRLVADVDSSFSRNCCWQIRGRTMRTMELGIGADVGFARSGRRWCRRRSSAASYRVIDNRSENLQHCQWSALPRSLSAAARKDQRNLAASTLRAALTRAREAAPNSSEL